MNINFSLDSKKEKKAIGTVENPLVQSNVPQILEVSPEHSGWRLDTWLSSVISPPISRSRAQKWLLSGSVWFLHQKNKTLQARKRVCAGEKYQIIPPPTKKEDLFQPAYVPFTVIYEDVHLAVVHKPAGIPVHLEQKQKEPLPICMVNGFLDRWPQLPTDTIRPGVVHRLDRDTEGLLIVAKHKKAQIGLMSLFAHRKVHKEYLTWIHGTLHQDEGLFELPIKRHPIHRLQMRVDPLGRKAITKYKVLDVLTSSSESISQVQLFPITGRTHQLRVHLAYNGSPVIGDSTYGKNQRRNSLNSKHKPKITANFARLLEKEKLGLLLFAHRLSLIHPFTHTSLDLELPIPERFERIRNIFDSK